MSDKRLFVVLGATLILFFAAGGLFGRFVLPERVVEKEKEVKVQVESEEAKEKIRELTAEVEHYRSNVHREETEVTHPDGTIERKKTETIVVEKTKEVEVIKLVDREVKVEVVKYVEREKEKTVETAKPQWRVGLLVGTDLTKLSVQPTAPWINPLLVGGHVERRIIGPVFVGVWGLSSGAGGISVAVEF
jgi:hypothetical protein